MNQLDVFYRAFADYKKQTEENRDCSVLRNAVSSACRDLDFINLKKTICTIDDDWIEAIEVGLTHIGKAIEENRQFILSRGEVQLIEKVKRVSKESVEHLAKHSDLISKNTENDENIIPDKLYTVERLTDYAVYENRFLYMLLRYLNDFISFRYEKILELTNTYNGNISMNKSVAVNKRKINFELKMTEEKRDDDFLKAHNPLREVLGRIDMILQTVIFYLETPLMHDVSKAAMLKPPITKTNVLKMNKNFKGAVELYDFVTSYDKLGYNIENDEEQINPFPDLASNEFSEIIMLVSFLVYKHSLKQEQLLKTAFQEEDDRRRLAESDKIKAQLARLKRRIEESGLDPTEYMLMLEKRNKVLEIDSEQLESAKIEIKKLKEEKEYLSTQIVALTDKVFEKEEQIVKLNEEYQEKIAKMISSHQKEMAEVLQKHKDQVSQLLQEHQNKIFTINEEHRIQIEKKDATINEKELLIVEKNAEMISQKNKYEKQAAEISKKHLDEINCLVIDYDCKVVSIQNSLQKKEQEYEILSREKTLLDARFLSLRKENSLISQDENFTTKESFDEIERQYNIFKTFMKEEWKKTKKRIRKEVFVAKSQQTKIENQMEENMKNSEDAEGKTINK